MRRQHVVTALLENQVGTLNRLTSVFRRKGVSLESLSVGDCEQSGYSRMTLVVSGDDNDLHVVMGQLLKLLDVVDIQDLKVETSVRRELALVRVDATPQQRGEIIEVVHVMGGRVAHLTKEDLTVEFTDEPRKIEHFLSLMEPYGLREVVRTGTAAMRVD
ncbi:MAG: acetolactate synthase small subunit [Fimbriimonadaceae bacterium]|nr:acetolactate synthase small subunit [Fimbriimonadaceae bacterium]